MSSIYDGCGTGSGGNQCCLRLHFFMGLLELMFFVCLNKSNWDSRTERRAVGIEEKKFKEHTITEM